MAIGVVLGVVFFLLVVGGAVAGGVLCHNDHKITGAVSFVFAAAMLICFILIPFSFHTVDTGELAVVKYMGEARDVRSAGTHFDFWVTKSYQRYDARVQNVDIITAAYSSDAQTMDIQMTLQYQIMGDKVMDIARQYGSLEVLQNRIQSIAIEKTKAVLSAYKAMDIISDRASMSPAVEQAIKDAVGDEYFVNVTAVVLTNIDFSDAFELAVEEKMIAEQKQLKAEYENQTAIAQAQAAAESKLLAAEAEAKALLLEAEATAQANELLENSLTEKILRQMYLDKWNGVLPDVVAGEDSMSMILPSDTFDGEEAP